MEQNGKDPRNDEVTEVSLRNWVQPWFQAKLSNKLFGDEKVIVETPYTNL